MNAEDQQNQNPKDPPARLLHHQHLLGALMSRPIRYLPAGLATEVAGTAAQGLPSLYPYQRVTNAMLKLLPLLLLTLLLTACGHSGLKLVDNGQPLAEIVVPDQPLSSVSLAANDLQSHLEQISGARLPIVTTPSAGVTPIYVGTSSHTEQLGLSVDDLPVEGFKIIATDRYLALIGHDEQRAEFPYDEAAWRDFAGEDYALPGVNPGHLNAKLGFRHTDATAKLYAVSEFLEQLGVRWYQPYEDGTVIPQKATIAVPRQNLVRQPAYPYREFMYYGAMRSDAAGVHWFKRLKYGTSYLYINNHTTWAIVGPEIQRQKHPEYYGRTKNGTLIEGYLNKGVPRLSSPEFRRTSLNFLQKSFDAYPQLKAMSLGMPDAFTQIDAEDSARWPSESSYFGKYSDYVWDYWIDMAQRLQKTHPDKYLACMAYGNHFEPPTNVETLPPNVALTMVYGDSALHLATSNHVRQARQQFLDKFTASNKLYRWDHYRFYVEGRPRYPVVFTRQLQQEMQQLAGICEGKFIEIYPTYTGPHGPRIECPGLSHLLHYLQGKLYWDPDLDLPALLDEYYTLYFGPAAEEMREFYEFSEAVWMRPETRSISQYSGFLKEDDVDRYFAILAAARAKAGDGTVYDRRIAQIEDEMQPLKKLFPNLQRTGPEFRAYITDKPVTLDGKLDEDIWTYVTMNYSMRDLVTGETPRKNGAYASFRLVDNGKNLLIGIRCDETAMDKLTATAKRHDDFDIFNDDVVEIYIETPERSYFKIVVNSDNLVWDESRDVTIIDRDTQAVMWNPGTQSAVHKADDGWSVEIKIPTADFGDLGPDKTFPWGINVCRTRLVNGKAELYAISPTGAPFYADLTKLGNLWAR